MASTPFNIAKGRAIEWYSRVKNNDPANSAFIVVLLKANEADATLEDYDDLDALLTAAGNTEADFTNYARKVLTDAELAAFPGPDDTNNRYDIDLPDQTWAIAGGASNNTLTKLLVCYDSDTTAGTDANIIPVCHMDFALVTDGSDVQAVFNSSGFYRAS